MATKITVALEDDLDGGPASETVRFGLGGAQYEIDLNKKNARAFRKKLTPFVEHARKAGPGQRRGPARTASSRQRSADIRAWAKATGLAVSDRGASPPALSTSTKPPPEGHYARPVTIGMNQSAQTVSGRGRPASGVSVGPSGCPPITAWGAPQAGQYQAAEAKTSVGAVDAMWRWRQRPHPSPRPGWRSAAGNSGRWLHTA